jgi:hypothetical protein
MFKSSEIAKLTTRISELEASLAAVTTERDGAATTHQAALDAITAERDKAAADLSAAKASHEAALKAKEEEVQKRIDQGVIDSMAAIGVPEANLPGRSPEKAAGTPATYAEALEQYTAIADATERAKFYATTIAPLLARPN